MSRSDKSIIVDGAALGIHGAGLDATGRDAAWAWAKMGHDCEVQAAFPIHARAADDYRADEADRMKRGHDGLLDLVTRAQLRATMEARGETARR